MWSSSPRLNSTGKTTSTTFKRRARITGTKYTDITATLLWRLHVALGGVTINCTMATNASGALVEQPRRRPTFRTAFDNLAAGPHASTQHFLKRLPPPRQRVYVVFVTTGVTRPATTSTTFKNGRSRPPVYRHHRNALSDDTGAGRRDYHLDMVTTLPRRHW